MPKKRHKPEEIVAKLRQVDALDAQVRRCGHQIPSPPIWLVQGS